MGFFDRFFQSATTAQSSNSLPNIFPLALSKDVFIQSDIEQTYRKILTDVIDRTHGIPEKVEPSLWDNCLQSEAQAGLISLLAEAMTKKRDLFLVYKRGVIRKALQHEEATIRQDYAKSGESYQGVFISFRKYKRTEMLELYSAFEYCVLGSLNKTLNISKAVQVKINDLRASVSLADSDLAVSQARSIANALQNGNDVLLDKNDSIESATPDTSSTEKAIVFLDAKRAFVLGLPLAYVSGEQTGGLGSTGEADMRAVERGLKQYFVSIIRPVVEILFGVTVEFRTEDFRQTTTALQVLKDFELTSDEYLSRESKQQIVARVFDLDADAEEKRIEAEAKELAREESSRPTPEPQVPPPNPGAQ